MKKSNILVVLGPGRCGTTSLYQAFMGNKLYYVFPGKEVGALSFNFSQYINEINQVPENRLIVELTPSNLLYSKQIINHLQEINKKNISFIIIDRPVIERMYSLHKHHLMAGRTNLDFEKYITTSDEIARRYHSNEIMKKNIDLTFHGLVEYDNSFIGGLTRYNVTILQFQNLFADLNRYLNDNYLPSVSAVHRNKSFIPRNQLIHRILRNIYSFSNMVNYCGLERLKGIYQSLNKKDQNITISNKTISLLNQYQEKWNSSLGHISHFSDTRV